MALEAFLISTCTLESNTKEKIENMPQNFEFVKARGNFLVQCEEYDNFDYIALPVIPVLLNRQPTPRKF